MRYLQFLLFVSGMLLFSACVSKSKFRTEFKKRTDSEARESVLLREMTDRKREAATMTKEIGDLNRTIGTQEEQLKNLRTEVASKMQDFGKNSGKLAEQVRELQSEQVRLYDSIAHLNARMEPVADIQAKRATALGEIFQELKTGLEPYASNGVALEMSEENVQVILPDALLFESNGLIISTFGLLVLQPLGNVLATHPSLMLEIQAHTDNVLPKNKALTDTWDWSQARAANLLRALVKEQNINPYQITPVGMGEFYPLDSNATPEGRAKNRRTVLTLRPTLPPIPRLGN